MRLTWVKYSYSAQLSPDGFAYRPALNVEISNGENLRIVSALVDSGTDTLVIDAALANSLKINPDECEKRNIGGIGGNNQGFMATISLKLPGFREKILVRALFVENTPFTALLGQRDFFDNYYVRFEHRKKVFFLAKAPRESKKI